VGVDWSDALPEARSFIEHNHWTFPNLRDGEGIVGNAYQLQGLPTTYVLDAKGRIRTTLRGPQDRTGSRHRIRPVRPAAPRRRRQTGADAPRGETVTALA